jgi:hypothetical protein
MIWFNVSRLANNWTLASGPMAEAVTHSTSRMTDEDTSAIATYLKDSDTRASASRAGLPPAITRWALVRRFTRISQRRDSSRPAHLSCVLRSAFGEP